MIRDLIDAIARLWFGHNTVDSGKGWHTAHRKAKASRAEADAIITTSELNDNKKDTL